MKRRKRWEVVAELFRDHPLPVVGAEVGVLAGTNAEHLLELMPELTLYMVDRWAEYLPEEISNAKRSRMPKRDVKFFEEAYWNACAVAERFGKRAVIIRGDSAESAALVPDLLDFVFIDAGHTREAVLRDLEAWAPKVRAGGWILGHDYGSRNHPGVAQAVDQFFPSRRVRRSGDHVFLVHKRR